MAKTFKLTNKQKEVLLDWGHKEYEFNQIEECVNTGIITNEVTHRKISWKTAIKKIGEREFLSGISRAAFHWTAMRNSDDNKECVYFDFSNYFK